MFKGYHHIGLAVCDTERSVKFYTDIGGKLTCSFPVPQGRIYMVDLGGGATVEILPFMKEGQEEANPRFAHIALECDDVPAAFKVLIDAGATVKSEPSDMVLMSEPPMNICNAFLFGPDGEQIELFCTKK